MAKKQSVAHHKIKIKKNDKVEVIAGREKGKTGKVLKVLPEKNRVLVEKVNLIKRHSRPSPTTGQGGIIEKEASLHISNVKVVCGKCMAPTRLGISLSSEGQRVRTCKKCGEIIEG